MRELASLAESDRKIALDRYRLLQPHLEDGRTLSVVAKQIGQTRCGKQITSFSISCSDVANTSPHRTEQCEPNGAGHIAAGGGRTPGLNGKEFPSPKFTDSDLKPTRTIGGLCLQDFLGHDRRA
jgi:hypothetical protein